MKTGADMDLVGGRAINPRGRVQEFLLRPGEVPRPIPEPQVHTPLLTCGEVVSSTQVAWPSDVELHTDLPKQGMLHESMLRSSSQNVRIIGQPLSIPHLPPASSLLLR